MDKSLNFYWDKEGDLLEITFRPGPGVMIDTANEFIQARVDEHTGEVLGLMVLGFSRMGGKLPVSVDIPSIITPEMEDEIAMNKAKVAYQ